MKANEIKIAKDINSSTHLDQDDEVFLTNLLSLRSQRNYLTHRVISKRVRRCDYLGCKFTQ